MNENLALKTYLYSLVSKYKVYLVALSLIAICAGLFNIFMNYQIKEIIDIIAKEPEADIILLLLLFVFYKAMYHGLYFIGRLFDIKYRPAILAEIIENIYTKTMKHSLHWFDFHLSGEISSKINDFQDSIMMLITFIYRSLASFAIIAISVIFLFTVHYLTAGVLIVFIIVYIFLLSPLLKKQLKLQEQCISARQETVGIINDSVANVFGIKIIGNIFAELKLKLLPAIKKWSILDKKTRQYDAYYVDMTDTILIIIMGGIQIWLLAYLYKSKQITAGDFGFISMITLTIHRELESLLENILFSINPKIATLKASYSYVNTPSNATDSFDAITMPLIKGDIKYENVTFSYDSSHNIFENLNLDIKSGEKIGIVGISGAGKTTLIKCLLKYFSLQCGRILVDNIDIAKVTEESLRSNISVIPQDISMFHRSILENLQIAKYDASYQEIEDACKKARIHDDIEKMPLGYHSIVGERGIKISGGQRQRIAIARAILKNSPILILDEATSALDTPTEILIQQSLNNILDTTKSTTIIIAHRLSTLLHMDRILVFDQGKIIENGTHIELLSQKGIYKALWNAQVGGFLPD